MSQDQDNDRVLYQVLFDEAFVDQLEQADVRVDQLDEADLARLYEICTEHTQVLEIFFTAANEAAWVAARIFRGQAEEPAPMSDGVPF